MKEFLVGDTIKLTWVSSDAAPSSIHYAVYDGSETLVDSDAMVSSGSGHYYGFFTIPDSGGLYYVAEAAATVGGKPFRRRVKFKAVTDEVD